MAAEQKSVSGPQQQQETKTGFSKPYEFDIACNRAEFDKLTGDTDAQIGHFKAFNRKHLPAFIKWFKEEFGSDIVFTDAVTIVAARYVELVKQQATRLLSETETDKAVNIKRVIISMKFDFNAKAEKTEDKSTDSKPAVRLVSEVLLEGTFPVQKPEPRPEPQPDPKIEVIEEQKKP